MTDQNYLLSPRRKAMPVRRIASRVPLVLWLLGLSALAFIVSLFFGGHQS